MVLDDKFIWNEKKGGYDFFELDWVEFYEVLKGNGLCNMECMVVWVKVWEDGVWVCDGLMVYVKKKVVV